MHEWVHCCDEAANHQLPIAVAFWIIWIVSMEEYSSLTQNLMQIYCSTHLVILNVKATPYTCLLNSIYHPPLTSTVKSSLFMHAHSSPLSLASRLHQCCTVILTMAGIFRTDLGRPGIISGFSILFHWATCPFLFQYYAVSITVDLWYSLLSSTMIPPTLSFFLKIAFAIQGLL